MNTCERCPLFSRAVQKHSKCELHVVSEAEEQMFNLNKFATEEKLEENELRIEQNLDCYLGPLNDSVSNTNFFFSLARPIDYPGKKDAYKRPEESVVEGHVFSLKKTVLTEAGNVKQPANYFLPLLENFGSRLVYVNTSQCNYGKIVLEYADGDICEENIRHGSRIIMICDKTAIKAPIIEHIPEDSSRILLICL